MVLTLPFQPPFLLLGDLGHLPDRVLEGVEVRERLHVLAEAQDHTELLRLLRGSPGGPAPCRAASWRARPASGRAARRRGGPPPANTCGTARSPARPARDRDTDRSSPCRWANARAWAIDETVWGTAPLGPPDQRIK